MRGGGEGGERRRWRGEDEGREEKVRKGEGGGVRMRGGRRGRERRRWGKEKVEG